MSHPEHLGRKRSRSKCEDGGCDFMPLSKRINNLHLDRPTGDSHCPSFGQPSHDGSSLERGMYEESSTQWGAAGGTRPAEGFAGERPQGPQGSLVTNTGDSSHGDNVPWMTEQMMAQYAPLLNQSDNPHYYENNKMLYALFMERLQRIPPH